MHGISALSPTILVASAARSPAVTETGLFYFRTDAGTWTPIGLESVSTGDVVVDSDGRIVYVDFAGSGAPGAAPTTEPGAEERSFAIRWVDQSGQRGTVLGVEAGLRAAGVAIDIDAEGTVYVDTETQTFVVGGDGIPVPVASHPPGPPLVAVSPAGALLVPAPAEAAGGAVAWSLSRGSARAREVVAEQGDCARSSRAGLSLVTGAGQTRLPFSCATNGAVWLDDSAFLLSIGDEGGTILTRVTGAPLTRSP